MSTNLNEPPDLHTELRDDASGARRAEVLNRLKALQDNCQAAKRQLQDREAYRQLQAASTAVAAALRIVEKLPATASDGN